MVAAMSDPVRFAVFVVVAIAGSAVLFMSGFRVGEVAQRVVIGSVIEVSR